MAGYPPHGMHWGMMQQHHPAMQQMPQRQQALPIEALGLTVGSRIEVRWDIVPDEDEGDPYTKWWGARIIRQAPPQPGVIGPCYIIAYDPEEGFDSEERTVRIMSLHDLVDLEDGDPLHWRREGERWEPPVEETTMMMR